MSEKINDLQDMAIYDRANAEHNILIEMYRDRERFLEKKKLELNGIEQNIKDQEELVKKYCENRIKTYKQEETGHLILDLTD